MRYLNDRGRFSVISSLKAAQILVDAHRCRLNDDEATDLRRRVNALTVDEMAELFRLARQNSARIFLVKQLDRVGGSGPALDAARVEIGEALTREQRRYAKIVELVAAFRAVKIDLIILKGNALGTWLYGDPYYKRMNDFDFLIRVKDLDRSKDVLRSLGYGPVGDLLDREKSVHATHHLSPWVSADLHCVLGIHWNLISPKRDEKVPVADLWSECVPLAEFAGTASRLSTAHFLMHLMLHLPAFKTGIREVADLTNLARFAPDAETAIARVPELAREWRAIGKVYGALHWVRAVDPTSPLLRILPEIESAVDTSERERMRRFSDAGARLLYFRTLQLSRVERAFARSWLSPSPRQRLLGWIRSWQLTMLPDFREGMAVRRMTDARGPLGWLAVRLGAPIAIWRALGHEYGGVKIALVTLINFGNAARSLVLWAIRPASAKLRHPAERILEELE